MGFLDVRTLLWSLAALAPLCCVIIWSLHLQCRGRAQGTVYFGWAFTVAWAGAVLMALRGIIPDWASIVVAIVLAALTVWLIVVGLERLVGLRGPHWQNALVVGLTGPLFYYFSAVHPSLTARHYLYALMSLSLFGQGAYLAFWRTEPRLRPALRPLGATMAAMCITMAIRIVALLIWAPKTQEFTAPAPSNAMIVLATLALHLALTFSAVVTVNAWLLHQVADQEERFSRVFQAAPYAGMIHRLSDSVIIDANEQSLRLLGVPRSALIGASLRSLGLWADADENEAVRREIRTQGRLVGRHVRFRNPAGQVIDTLLSAETVDIGGQPYILSSFLDISANVRSDQVLRRSEESYRLLIETHPDAILLVDIAGGILLANPVARAALGVEAEDAYGYALADLLPQAAAGIIQKASGAGANERETHPFESVMATGPGRTAPAIVAATPVLLRTSAVAILVVARDTTDQHRAEANREQMELRLIQAQKMESVGRLAGGVAHEFNNVLTGILNYVELASADLPAGHPARSIVADIADDAKRSAQLTQRLLLLANREEAEPRPTDLNQRMAGMMAILRSLAGEGVRVTFQPCEGPSVVLIDPANLDQIALNLVVNARDAMAAGGEVTLRSSMETLDAEAVSGLGLQPGEYVRMSVADTGPGLTEEVRGHLFEPFFTTKPEGKGTGLGLATVHGVVKRAGGTVTVESRAGAGAEFRIYLPVCADQDECRVAVEATPDAVGREQILLVEDEKSIRLTVQRFLRDAGYTVAAAASPEEALRILTDDQRLIDLMLTDVVMPGMSGPELAGRVRSRRPAMRVAYMSGYPADTMSRYGLAPGKAPFLAKPFDRHDLLALVRATLDDETASPTAEP
ncbi:MAG: PAS domain S-box protein [Armatimonadetes bacterium]|nr:PAS domain S-box protein [Armatimonadota bacterium]